MKNSLHRNQPKSTPFTDTPQSANQRGTLCWSSRHAVLILEARSFHYRSTPILPGKYVPFDCIPCNPDTFLTPRSLCPFCMLLNLSNNQISATLARSGYKSTTAARKRRQRASSCEKPRQNRARGKQGRFFHLSLHMLKDSPISSGHARLPS